MASTLPGVVFLDRRRGQAAAELFRLGANETCHLAHGHLGRADLLLFPQHLVADERELESRRLEVRHTARGRHHDRHDPSIATAGGGDPGPFAPIAQTAGDTTAEGAEAVTLLATHRRQAIFVVVRTKGADSAPPSTKEELDEGAKQSEGKQPDGFEPGGHGRDVIMTQRPIRNLGS